MLLLSCAVALMLELLSCSSSLSGSAPLSSSRCGVSLRVVTYGRELRAIKELVAKSCRSPDRPVLVTYRRSNHARGRRIHIGMSDAEGLEVERVQHVYAG